MILNFLPLSSTIDVSKLTVSVSSTTYNGSTKYLSNLITVSYNGVTLTNGTDYSLSGTTSSTAAGSKSATLTGLGKYKGTRTVSWAISQRSINSTNTTISTNSLTWSGSSQTLNPTVKYSSTTLTSGTDYTISGNTGTNVNSYTLTLTGKGNYSGTKTFSWSIVARSISDCSFSYGLQYTWSGSTLTCAITVDYGSTSLVEGTDYTVSGNTGTNIGSYTATVTGKGNFTGTKTINWSIVARNISNCTVTGTSLTWSGSSQTCSPIVKYGSTTLTSGTDYTTSGTTSATAIGSYTLTLTGTGNYTGTKSVTWTIARRPMSTVNVSSASVPYTGYLKTADIRLFITRVSGSITYDSYLVEGTDYTISGNTGTNAGTYTATVTGKGNFTGTRSVTWYISKASNNPTINPTSLTIYGANTTGTISITNNVSGNTITVSSGNTSIATVSKSGNTITVTPKANGSTTITVTCAGSDNYQLGTATCSVTVYMFSDSTATASDLLSGTLAYTKNGLITGTIPILGATTYNPSTSNLIISSGRYLSGKLSVRGVTTNLTSNVISSRTGLFIANVLDALDWGIITITGTYTLSSDITGATPATANKIVKGYSAWVDGSEIKGSAIINANVVASGKTFSMSEGSTTTITPYGAGRSVIGESGVAIGSSYMLGRIRIKDSGGTVIETILTGKVTFSYTKSGTTITVSAKNGSTTLATYKFTY